MSNRRRPSSAIFPPCSGATGFRVLVAGGAGFLGSHLCRRLLDHGAEVVCVDNLMTGNAANVAALRDDPRFSFVLHDIGAPLSVDGPIHQIFNLACPASPAKYQLDPLHTFRTSVFGAMNLLELARQKRARILQASTSEVYGDPEISPQPESYRGSVNTMGPRACYDEGKRAAETLFYDYGRRYDIQIRVARIFNTYGPQMDLEDGRVVSNLVVQSLSGKPLTIYGSGLQTRSFCYVDDLVDGLMRLMGSPSELRYPVNLGNPDEFTILELAELILDITGSSAPLEYRDLPVDDPKQRCPDITLARVQLGWEPLVPLREGLKRTIESFADALSSRSRPSESFKPITPNLVLASAARGQIGGLQIGSL